MPVVGAVLTLASGRLEAFVACHRDDDRVVVGAPAGDRLPFVVQTDSRREDKDFWRAIETHPDVLNVEIAFAHFADLTQPNTPDEVTP